MIYILIFNDIFDIISVTFSPQILANINVAVLVVFLKKIIQQISKPLKRAEQVLLIVEKLTLALLIPIIIF